MIKYLYTDSDLLENRQNYQMSPFEGSEFLISYFESRKNIIKKLLPKNNLIGFNNQYFIQSQSKNIFYKDNFFEVFFLTDLFLNIIMEINSLTNNKMIDSHIDLFMKKFKIQKRFFLKYKNMKEISKDYS